MKKVIILGRIWKKKNFFLISCLNFRLLGNLEAPDTPSLGKLRRRSLEPWPSEWGPGSAGSPALGKLLEAQMLQPHPDLNVNKTRETCVRFQG